jgi:hypothetical protein
LTNITGGVYIKPNAWYLKSINDREKIVEEEV